MTSRLDALRALLAAGTAAPWAVKHNSPYEESRIYVGLHQRALLDGRMLLNERADADLIVALRNNADALLRLAEAAQTFKSAHEKHTRAARAGSGWDLVGYQEAQDALFAALDALLADEAQERDRP